MLAVQVFLMQHPFFNEITLLHQACETYVKELSDTRDDCHDIAYPDHPFSRKYQKMNGFLLRDAHIYFLLYFDIQQLFRAVQMLF